MARLRLSFLGTPEVHHAGEVLTFRTRKALALLIHLIVEGGFHSRQNLTALLWPESDTRRGQMSLRRALASLRNALGDTEAGVTTYILIEGDTLGFNFNADFALDTAKLESSQLIHTPLMVAPELIPEHLVQLQTIVELYRGDFLKGFTLKNTYKFDEWAANQREVYHRQMDLIFERLTLLQFETGQTASALETSMRWVQHNIFSEAAYRRLMQLHFSAGDRTAALWVYEKCRSILAEELDLEPDPETLALAERIRAETPPISQERTRETVLPEPRSVIIARPFVGRAAEHRLLVELYYTVRQTRAQMVTLIGDAGIGKTRLAAEFLSWATMQGAQILSGRAFETGGNLPYQPWTEILRCRTVREALTQNLLSDVWLGELSRLLPELLDNHPDISPLVVDESAAQARLFEAVAKLGEELARRAPLIVFVDDFQWVDSASLDLLHYVARRWAVGDTPVLLLLSLREEELAITPALVEWLTSLGRDIASTQLKLDSLTYDDLLQWIQYLAGSDADHAVLEYFGHWLYDETGGQPLYIKAMLEALLERRILYVQVGDSEVIEFKAAASSVEILRDFIPPGIREIILARLTQLSPNAFAMLSAAAVLGHRLTSSICAMLPISLRRMRWRLWTSCLQGDCLLNRRMMKVN